MKKPKTLTPPPVDTRKELFVETQSRCEKDYHSGEQFGSWETIYDSLVKRVSRNSSFLNKWSFEAFKVPDEVYNAQSVYVIYVIYSSGDSFGNSSGNLAVAFITEMPDEALECKKALEEQGSDCNYDCETNPRPLPWDKNFRHHPKSVRSGFAPWFGYFEHIESVEIGFFPIIG